MRLNMTLRQKLIRQILDRQFAKDRAALRSVEEALAEQLYEERYTKETRDEMYRLREGWLEERDEIEVQVAGSWLRCAFAKPHRFLAMDGRCVLSMTAKSDLAKALRKLQEARSKLREDERDARNQIQVVLNSVATIKRLHEVWPESKRFTDGVVEEKPANLPALPIGNLNRLLGIS